jgi:hypothetical protein
MASSGIAGIGVSMGSDRTFGDSFTTSLLATLVIRGLPSM